MSGSDTALSVCVLVYRYHSALHALIVHCALFLCAHLLQPADKVALLEDLQGVLGKCQQGQSRQLTQDLNYRRAGELPPVLLHPLQASDTAQSTGQQHGHVTTCTATRIQACSGAWCVDCTRTCYPAMCPVPRREPLHTSVDCTLHSILNNCPLHLLTFQVKSLYHDKL